MKIICRLITSALFLSVICSPLNGQDMCYEATPECSSAYMESSNTAHWSVYIPIAIFIGAAIWFGVSDNNHSSYHSSSNSQDALGSIANSKRISSSNHASFSKSFKSSYRSKLPFLRNKVVLAKNSH